GGRLPAPADALRHGLPRPRQPSARAHRAWRRGLGGDGERQRVRRAGRRSSRLDRGSGGRAGVPAGGVEARAAAADGAWVGIVRSSVYVGGRVEYVVDLAGVTVRATGPADPRLPRESRAQLTISPRAVRLWPASEGVAR